MVKIKKAEYVLSAAWKSQWPEESFPEMCLAGRSNVGKSSFINAMLNHNGLAFDFCILISEIKDLKIFFVAAKIIN